MTLHTTVEGQDPLTEGPRSRVSLSILFPKDLLVQKWKTRLVVDVVRSKWAPVREGGQDRDTLDPRTPLATGRRTLTPTGRPETEEVDILEQDPS